MATEVKVNDQLSDVTEITILEWKAEEGDRVKAGEPLVVVATDKVDQEFNAPADGVLLKIIAKRNALVPVDMVLALIGQPGEAVGNGASVATTPAVPPPAPSQPAASQPTEEVRVTPVAERVAEDLHINLSTVTGTGPGGRIVKENVLAAVEKKASAPQNGTNALPGDLADTANLSVRRLAAQYNLDLAKIAQGRPLSTLTRYDVLAAAGVDVAQQFIPPAGWDQPAATPQAAAVLSSATPTPAPAIKPTEPTAKVGARQELVPHARNRKLTAEATVRSAFNAPHVTTMWDVEMTQVLAHRTAHKGEFAAAGVNLTVTAYLVEAILAGLRAVPAANATWKEDGVVVKRYYNIGMAVALPADAYGMGGLIVPVIKNAGDLNLMGLARAINDLADRARKGQLKSDDISDGTFSLSNYGTSGSRFQTPIIVQPQVGILGVGAIEKRPVVISQGHPLEANSGDYLSFRPMTTLGFSYDHRVLDGATADAFCKAVKDALEGYK